MFNTIEHDIWLFSEDSDCEQVLLPGNYVHPNKLLFTRASVAPGTVHPAEVLFTPVGTVHPGKCCPGGTCKDIEALEGGGGE